MREQLNVLALLHDTLIELSVLQRHGGIQVGDVLVRRLFGKLVAYKGIAHLVKAFNELPKQEAFLKVFVFEDRVGADHGGSDIGLAHSLHEGGGHVGVQGLADTLDTREDLGVLGVQLLIGLGGLRSER